MYELAGDFYEKVTDFVDHINTFHNIHSITVGLSDKRSFETRALLDRYALVRVALALVCDNQSREIPHISTELNRSA